MLEGAAVLLLFAFCLFLVCSCGRMCARRHDLQSQRRARAAASRSRGLRHDHVLVAVIPSSRDGLSTPPQYEFNDWGPPPPPYTPSAPATSNTDSSMPPTSNTINSRFLTASPPLYNEEPPPYI